MRSHGLVARVSTKHCPFHSPNHCYAAVTFQYPEYKRKKSSLISNTAATYIERCMMIIFNGSYHICSDNRYYICIQPSMYNARCVTTNVFVLLVLLWINFQFLFAIFHSLLSPRCSRVSTHEHFPSSPRILAQPKFTINVDNKRHCKTSKRGGGGG